MQSSYIYQHIIKLALNFHLLVYFIGYIMSTKTLPYQGHRNSRRPYWRIFNQEWKGLNKAIDQERKRLHEAIYLPEKDRITSENFTAQQNWFPYRPSWRPEAAFGHQSQKVRVRYLSERPIWCEPPRAPVRYLSRRPSRRKPPRAPWKIK
jgi:hypothetical protein